LVFVIAFALYHYPENKMDREGPFPFFGLTNSKADEV